VIVFGNHFRRLVYVCLAAVLAGIFSCSEGTVLEKAEKEYSEGNYRETVFLVRHHFRRGGQRSPELLFLAGKALLRLGIEAEATDYFAEAYSADSTWADMIAQVMKKEALESLEKGLTSKGRRFILQAVNYEGRIDMGRYNAMAGEIFLDRKDYRGAAFYFERFLADHPDTAGAAEVMMNLGESYEGMGETVKAMEIYRLFQERYSKSRLVSTARWKLENLLLDSGEEMLTGGDREEARRILEELAAEASNPLVREKANFMLGEIYERMNDYRSAVRYYSEVVHLNLGSSGRLVEKAKERIVRIEEEKKNLR